MLFYHSKSDQISLRLLCDTSAAADSMDNEIHGAAMTQKQSVMITRPGGTYARRTLEEGAVMAGGGKGDEEGREKVQEWGFL